MMTGIWTLLYPFTAFLFIRGALRSFANWAVEPRPAIFILGVAFSALTFHAGWRLFSWTAILPHWWITPLVVTAFAWIVAKNVRHIWVNTLLRKVRTR